MKNPVLPYGGSPKQSGAYDDTEGTEKCDVNAHSLVGPAKYDPGNEDKRLAPDPGPVLSH